MPDTPEKLSLTTFQAAAAAKVADVNPTVLDRVVEHFAEIEATRRVPLLLAGLAKEDEISRQLGKFKPEKTFDVDGNELAAFYTRGTLDAKKKAEENLKRWQDALGKAIIESDYASLEKLVKSGGNDNGQKKPEAEAE